MKTQIQKEIRLIIVSGLLTIIAPLLEWTTVEMLRPKERVASDLHVSYFILVIVVQIGLMQFIASKIFGDEFKYQTMGRLLTEPISRMKIYGLKMVVLVGLLSILVLVDLGYLWQLNRSHLRVIEEWNRNREHGSVSVYQPFLILQEDWDGYLRSCWISLLWGAFAALSAPPCFALLTRKTESGVALTLFVPMLLIIGLWLLVWRFPGLESYLAPSSHPRTLASVYCVALLSFGYSRFARLEV